MNEGLAAKVDPTGSAIVRGYVPAIDWTAADRAVAEARTMLGHLQAFGLRPIGELGVQPVHEEDWAEAWKRHFPVLRVGRRLVIKPIWRRYRARSNDVVLALDPGMAFGTGLHPTTRLCLASLEKMADESAIDGRRVLDVGCGSGILAIAAVQLGASSVVGIDTDPIAVAATDANARHNGLAPRVSARQGTLPIADSPFGVVLANLIASLLVDLAPELAAAVAPGGRLIASGIFIDRESDVRSALQAAGLNVVDRSIETDWVCLRANRLEPAPPTD